MSSDMGIKCSVIECDRNSHYRKPTGYPERFPVCPLHYAQWRMWGEFRTPAWSLSNGSCSVMGCDRPHKARGLCETHVAHRKAGKALVPLGPKQHTLPKNRDKICKYGHCQMAVYAKDVCSRHYRMERNPGSRLRDTYETGQKCEVPHCEVRWGKKGDLKRGHCPRHDRMILTWNLSHEQVKILDEITECPICGRSDQTMVIDHDHSCCPAQLRGRHCGDCIRGVICSPCNKGLGMFDDNLAVMLNAMDYLGQYRERGPGALPWSLETLDL